MTTPRRRLAAVVVALPVAALVIVLALTTGPRSSPTRAAASQRAVPILMYHRISPAPPGTTNPRLWVPAARFRQQVDALARAGYRAVTLAQVWRAWHGRGTLPAKPVVLTFDDGYASQFRAAAPTLRAHRWPGVLYLEVARLDAPGGLRQAEVRRMLDDGWELGGHTLTHPDLTTLSAARLRSEVNASRTALRHDFHVPVSAFAYPFGRFDDRVATAVRAAGYTTATTVHAGLARPNDDPYRLDRILADGRSPSALLALLRAHASG